MKLSLVLCLLVTAVGSFETAKLHCNFICPKIYAPVCGTDHVTYSNECMMKGQLCVSGLTDQVKILHQGPCDASVITG